MSNNIAQKGLAIRRGWSGTVVHQRRWAPRDPAPPASEPRWGFGGVAARGHELLEDLNV